MDPLANARMGIQLIQSGQRAEAISYLRRSVQVEPVTAEVWLWLAHVAADYHEYNHCVQQALSLDPNHTTARQMQHALQQPQGYPAMPPARPPTGQYPAVPPPNIYSSTQSQPLAVDGSLVASLEKKGKTRKLRRRLLIILFICVILGGAAVAALSASGQSFDEWLNGLFSDEDSDDNGEIIQIDLPNSIGNLGFEVRLPDTWLLADTNSETWVEKRNELNEQLGDGDGETFWESVEIDVDTVTLSGGRLSPPITLIETDVDEEYVENPPWLQLVRIIELPEEIDGTHCEDMHSLAESEEAELEQIDDERQSVVDYGIKEQGSDRCAFMVHFRDQSPLTNLIEHKYVIQIPVGEDRLAEWHFTIIDELHDDYQSTIQNVIGTLKEIEG